MLIKEIFGRPRNALLVQGMLLVRSFSFRIALLDDLPGREVEVQSSATFNCGATEARISSTSIAI